MFLTRRDYTRAFYVTSFAASILLAAAPAKSADAPILSMRPAASATPSLSPAGRVLIGRGKDYTPVGANTDTEVLADQLSKSMKARRDFAWKVVEALLLPIKVQLPNGGAQVDVPLWQTWYDGVGPTNETKALFTLFFQKLKANPSADLATTADQALAEQATKDLSQSVTTENFTATLTQNVGATISTDLGGQGTTLFSPAFVKHMMVSAKQVENCKQTGITPTTPPPSPTNFSQCINEFPREAVMIKTSWKDLAGGIAVHDTSGPAMSALMSEGTWPGANHPTKKPPLASPPPTSDQIYTNETANGRKFGLVGIHFVTKDVRDWVWISLWWSPDSSKDFGADRPASVASFNGGVWANYKMCVGTAFDEADPQPWSSYTGTQSALGASIKAVYDTIQTQIDRGIVGPIAAGVDDSNFAQGARGPWAAPHNKNTTWCTNPFVEVQAGNGRTSCIGCHQLVLTESQGLIPNRGPANFFESILGYDPQFGRSQNFKNFSADFSWAFQGQFQRVVIPQAKQAAGFTWP